ncbi:hypothetical protein [Actinoplanes aureus]|uniref:Uncharacterized protein n=1 Tax=Actinoplanes aureus TaxID=2792083 RepID=A0A931C7B4_9ACTN|nr:hypothetical protein [Actinoplanes aureus]MBG0564774.1 hypothetical protein [Actinoplanes aureus]
MLSEIVFRRLGEPAERSQAGELLVAGGCVYRSPRLAGDERWSGLWNLTAADGAALTAAAATMRMSARILEVRALAARPGEHCPAMWARLVRELADTCRARGAESMVAGFAGGDAAAEGLLRRAGFDTASDPGLPGLDSIKWVAREV